MCLAHVSAFGIYHMSLIHIYRFTAKVAAFTMDRPAFQPQVSPTTWTWTEDSGRDLQKLLQERDSTEILAMDQRP